MSQVTISRRQFVRDITISGTACGCGFPASAQPGGGRGCWIPDDKTQPYFERSDGDFTFNLNADEPLASKSGDPTFDRALAQGLSSLSAEFGVLPAFGFYREASDGRNAKATARRVLDRADGTVLFGLNLLGDLLRLKRHRDAAVMAVCAHEYGHLIANKLSLRQQLDPDGLQPFRSEQFADHMAGFYAGIRKLRNRDFPAVAFAVQQGISGGPEHGSNAQRSAAVIAGFHNAFDQKMTTSDGIESGFRYAMAQPTPSN